jgi:tetratricopeptide (TPR) repeat protein
LSQALLDELWDFADPVASERRFAGAREAEPDAARRAELLTQQARAVGLQGRFETAAELLDGVEILSDAIQVRVLLERGRVHNSSGRPADAVPLFAEASDLALHCGLTFLAIDALHMSAIADPAAADTSCQRALALVGATDDRRTRRWAVSLHNNLGWTLHEAQRYDEALDEFESAHVAAMDVGTPEQEFVARWAIARCLRSLGRHEEALDIQQRLAIEDPNDTYVTDEITALRAALLEEDGPTST